VSVARILKMWTSRTYAKQGKGKSMNSTIETAPPTVERPRLGGYADMQKLTGRSYQTIAGWVCKRKLRPGVYIGNGLFNINWVNEIIAKHETFFLKRG
jgi:hypothetical protein